MATDTTPNTEVVPVDDLTPVLLGDAELPYDDPETAARSIVERILSADSVEALFERTGLKPWTDLLDQKVALYGVRFQKSAFDAGPGVYGVFTIGEPKTGELIDVACSGRNVMAQAYRLYQLGKLPLKVKLVEAGKTASGFTPLWLELAS